MAPRSRLSIAKSDICAEFDKHEQRVFTRTEIEQILSANRSFWRLAQSTTTNKFIEYLTNNTALKVHRFKFPNRPINRYSWGDVPSLEIIQSLNRVGYFSHFTALYLNGLTEQVPKTVYLNVEQKLRSGGGELTQAGVNRAFSSKCRTSNNTTVFGAQSLCLLSGGNTDALGVGMIDAFDSAKVRVTSIERTLIDCTVRPVYAGGVYEVADAFKNAHPNLSVNRMVSHLKAIGYTYPYHQAIGYYLERAGVYSDTQLSLLQNMGVEFDFYLAHKLVETDYNEKWRLFVPKGF